MLIIDGTDLIFGRAASKIAKELLNKQDVILVNAEKMIISGNPKAIVERYRVKRSLKTKSSPEKSARWPRIPSKFVKRILRGMLPKKKAKGRDALKRLKVYEGVPSDITETPIVYEDCKAKGISKYVTIGRICELFGYKA